MTSFSHLAARYFQSVEFPRHEPAKMGTATRYGVAMATRYLSLLEKKGFTLSVNDIRKALAADPHDFSRTEIWGADFEPREVTQDDPTPAMSFLRAVAVEIGDVAALPNTNHLHTQKHTERVWYTTPSHDSECALPRLNAIPDEDRIFHDVYALLASKTEAWDESEASDMWRVAYYLRSQARQKSGVYPKNIRAFTDFRTIHTWSFGNLENMVVFSLNFTM